MKSLWLDFLIYLKSWRGSLLLAKAYRRMNHEERDKVIATVKQIAGI